MSQAEVEELLRRVRDGDDAAEQQLFGLLYDDLKRMAEGIFRSQRGRHTLQATAVLHEAFLKLSTGRGAGWNDRTHFLAVAARAMRQVLVNHARDRMAQKRGGPDAHRVTMTGLEPDAPGSVLDVVTLNDALVRLSELDERQGRIAELRLFAGLGLQEIADTVGVSKRTAEMDWRMAKQWLADVLR